jgi:hypothetical protein
VTFRVTFIVAFRGDGSSSPSIAGARDGFRIRVKSGCRDQGARSIVVRELHGTLTCQERTPGRWKHSELARMLTKRRQFVKFFSLCIVPSVRENSGQKSHYCRIRESFIGGAKFFE